MGKLVWRNADGSRRQPKPKREAFTRARADGGYDVYHPTKGWRAYSLLRVKTFETTEAKRNGLIPWWRFIPSFEIAARGVTA